MSMYLLLEYEEYNNCFTIFYLGFVLDKYMYINTIA